MDPFSTTTVPNKTPIMEQQGLVQNSAAATGTQQGQSTVMNKLPSGSLNENRILDKRRIQELVKEIDPLEQLDDDVEELLINIADDFIENIVNASSALAKHRKSNTLEVKDVQLHLERNWNMWIPGFGSDELRPYKKATTTEAHKQRMALIRKTMKKF
ncbi:transcription initiation factor TFIID subunit 12-like isoform X2 [Tubulanus polymorphus]|uniref:transcription initiation factor TFIID subunit 12-like isoform X2 n=1 Tax=Tubulanus polymorphus TaxID=672921 RepID=UPI003DA2C477